MFDLFRSRDKAVRLLLGGLLVVVALSMLTYLIPSYGSGGSAGDNVVAEIGKQPLTLQEVQRTLQAQMRGRQIPPDMIPIMVPQIVEGLINERAMAYEAQRLGFKVTDAEIANSIRNMIPQLFPGGQFVGKEAYANMLAQQNLSIEEFEQDLARQIQGTRLRDLVLQGVVVTPGEIEQEYRRRNEKVTIEYVKLTADKLRNEVQVTPEEMQSYFRTNQASYQVPEKRNLAVLIIDQAKIEQSLNPSDADLERMYNQNKDSFRVPERVKVRHILLKTSGNAQADAAVKTKAEDILSQIKKGGNFAELAKKNSEDPGSASNGGELPDWVVRGQTVPEFEKVAFSLNPGQTSDLVKTQYGYHIIQVIAKEQAHLRTFAEVKSELAANWKKQQVNEIMQRSMDQAQAALTKDPSHPENVAASLNLQVVRADGYGPGSTIPEVGANKDFEDSVASLKKGEVSQPVALPDNKVAMAVATDVIPAHPAPFAEVQSQVREALIKSKADKLLMDRSNELYQKAGANGGDLKKAAQSMGLEVKTSEPFDRQGAVEGLGPASYVSDAFLKPVGSLIGPLSNPDGRVIAKVISHDQADMSKLASQREAIRSELKQRLARDRAALFEAGLRQQLIKEGKIKVHQDVISRLMANYRG
ncbi:MAG: peptidylprolyl isomerase [Acidobacteria bacterium]|nr:peptidylprolyl isomerase [Acidobacteriota bacterium]